VTAGHACAHSCVAAKLGVVVEVAEQGLGDVAVLVRDAVVSAGGLGRHGVGDDTAVLDIETPDLAEATSRTSQELGDYGNRAERVDSEVRARAEVVADTLTESVKVAAVLVANTWRELSLTGRTIEMEVVPS
jgi:hypothetical protein